jgi:hypothetical protein
MNFWKDSEEEELLLLKSVLRVIDCNVLRVRSRSISVFGTAEESESIKLYLK